MFHEKFITNVRSNVQQLKELLRISYFEILYKTNKKNKRLVNFASSMNLYPDIFLSF